MEVAENDGLYGTPPAELVSVAASAVQFSPLIVGAYRLEDQAEGRLRTMIVEAPQGTVERRSVMALALRSLRPQGSLTILAPKDKGGARLRKELAAFGCVVTETARRHYRICVCERPVEPIGIREAIAEGAPRLVPETGSWSQPGIFSWNRVDPGSALLIRHLPALAGRGADFGAGIGYLSRAILGSPKVEHVTLIDIDRRAIDAAKRNIPDPRATITWADLRAGTPLSGLNFVVMNPPFHDDGAEDRSLGQTFIRRAAESLRTGGVCWLVANRHLPYEEVLKSTFKRVDLRFEGEGYKIYEARR